jgi:hypothetical protein
LKSQRLDRVIYFTRVRIAFFEKVGSAMSVKNPMHFDA